MNKQEVRRLALLGAAKVAFSATLVGCGGIVVYESASGSGTTGGAGGSEMKPVPWTTVASTTSSEATTVATTTATTSTGTNVGQCEVPASAPYSDTTVACCDALVDAEFPTWSPPVQDPTPDLVACCDVVLTEASAKEMTTAASSGSGVPYVAIAQCCQVPGVSPTPQPLCTPWGPPVPPAMIDDLDWLEEAA
jgi:hypothetical protein